MKESEYDEFRAWVAGAATNQIIVRGIVATGSAGRKPSWSWTTIHALTAAYDERATLIWLISSMNMPFNPSDSAAFKIQVRRVHIPETDWMKKIITETWHTERPMWLAQKPIVFSAQRGIHGEQRAVAPYAPHFLLHLGMLYGVMAERSSIDSGDADTDLYRDQNVHARLGALLESLVKQWERFLAGTTIE